MTSVLVLAAGLFAIIQTFATVTLSCREYYDWYLFDHNIGRNLMRAFLVFSGAMALYFLTDVLRPKRQRVAFLVRVFQFLLVFSMASVTFIQWGMLLPHERHAEASRSLHSALERVFMIQRDWLYLEFDGQSDDPQPVQLSRSFLDISPFAIKAGVLRCEVDAQVEDLQQEQARNYWESARPFAITEERR